MTDRARRVRRGLLAFALVSFAAFAAAADTISAASQLAALLEPVQHLKAEFTQTVMGARRELLQSAEGYVRVARPQQFKWVLLAPYPQTIVTVGDRLVHLRSGSCSRSRSRCWLRR